ncbi:MAG: YdiU family protein [Burkholderiales bacterium]|nr:YdiU family protein [Burkholderiales bacterium]
MREAPRGPAPLCELGFANEFVRCLPGDMELRNVPRQVRTACYTRVDPTPVTAPRLLGWSEDLANQLGIERPAGERDAALEVLAGNRVPPAAQPYAARYGGHQFGHWAGQLGDGRAITLGEVLAADGTRQELQLKGAGCTPYSRSADGRAVLRSSLREFVCSEAMHWLGVPTTRALSLAATGEPVMRDMFYDGHPREEPGAVVCRVAPSFLRFGNFQIHAALGELESLKKLTAFSRERFFPDQADIEEFFAEVCRRTGLLMADWMRLGFVHGVMNTDNMSLLGLTIDYGPYGWIEGYDLAWTPNTTDAEGRRYCYGNQPHIAQWNLARLAEALLPLGADKARLREGIELYSDTFAGAWREALAAKLGLADLGQPGDEALVEELFGLLSAAETDFTLFFRNLATPTAASLRPAYYGEAPAERLDHWLALYRARLSLEAIAESERQARMNSVNPKYVFRNYLAQLAIDGLEKDDPGMLERLMRVLRRPYDEQPGHEDLAARRPEWARHRAGCSALSCSS